MTGETILVVDDEANIRDLARLYLEQDGFQVLTATSGRQALEQVRFDLGYRIFHGFGCCLVFLLRHKLHRNPVFSHCFVNEFSFFVQGGHRFFSLLISQKIPHTRG